MNASRHPALARLEPLIGEWKIESRVDGELTGEGMTSFEWFERGAFLIQRADGKAAPGAPAEWTTNSPFPTTAIFGLDDTSERFSMIYADSRDVFRVYEMTLEHGLWKIWREAPGFSQRFSGQFNGDASVIEAAWEISTDGITWSRDFDLSYIRLGRPASG